MHPFAHWRVIRKWACDNYGISQPDLEFLFELHDKGQFITQDFKNGELLQNWDTRRWTRLQEGGYIAKTRKKEGKHQRYRIFEVTQKTKGIIRRCYSIISGREKIPTKIYEKKTIRSSEYRRYLRIKQINDATNEKG